MSLDYRIESAPKDVWGQITGAEYSHSAFRADWGSTAELLGDELRHLTGSEECVLRMTITADDLTVTGKLRAGREPTSRPGVQLVCTTKDGQPFTMLSASWWNWRHNVRAIAATLQALRAIDRWGATSGEQYRGFLALPPGGGYELGQTTGMTRDEALRVVLIGAGWLQTNAELGGLSESSPQHLADALRAARRRNHPDRTGDDAEWNQLDYAARVLGLES